MDFKKLEYLESIYRLKSFSKAAEEHYISQPSISNAIQKLENELGLVLIDRNAKPLAFTPEGIHFMSHVYDILNVIEETMRDMQNMAAAKTQTLNMIVHSTLDDWVVTKIFSSFHERYPQYEVCLHEDINDIMLKKIFDEEIDLAYTLIPDDLDLDMFKTIPLQTWELYALLPKNHPLEQYDRIPLSMLKSECLLTFSEGSLILSRLEREFHQLHITPKFRTLNQIHFMQNLVEQNCGISFVTKDELSLLKDTDTYSIRPVQEPIKFLKGFLMKRGIKRTAIINCMISFVNEAVIEKRKELNQSR